MTPSLALVLTVACVTAAVLVNGGHDAAAALLGLAATVVGVLAVAARR